VETGVQDTFEVLSRQLLGLGPGVCSHRAIVGISVTDSGRVEDVSLAIAPLASPVTCCRGGPETAVEFCFLGDWPSSEAHVHYEIGSFGTYIPRCTLGFERRRGGAATDGGEPVIAFCTAKTDTHVCLSDRLVIRSIVGFVQ
jgi:hypothetical protein